MTVILFLAIKAAKWYDTPYDWPVVLILFALDVIGVAEWMRIWLHRQGR